MTPAPEQMRVDVARWMGWEFHLSMDDSNGVAYPEFYENEVTGVVVWDSKDLPDYAHDLNAVAECEAKLNAEQEVLYVDILAEQIMSTAYEDDPRYLKSNLSSRDSTYRATALQRLEALHRTLFPEKWKE